MYNIPQMGRDKRNISKRQSGDIVRSGLFRSQLLLLAGLIAMVCVITAAVYWPVLSAKAVSFDDEYYLLGNKLVQNPSFASAVRFFREVLNPSTVKGYYQPLTMISLMVDCAFGGGPKYFMPFHVTSLLLHLLNTAMVIVFLYMLFGNIWAAAIIGLLFGIHPITIESIPWISERKTLLAAFFAICSLIFYVKYVKNTESRIQNSVEKCKKSFTTVYCLLTTVFYLLALLSKPSAMPLPFMMLVLDFWPLKRLGKKAFLEKTPLFIICAVFVVFAVISQRTFGMRGPGSYSAADTVLLICHNNLAYLCNIFWPVNLSLFYAFPTWIPIPVIIIATIALAAGLIISLRWTRALSAGWLFFFLAVFPVLGVTWVHDMIIADRHAYLPMLGILIVVSSLLSAAAGRKNILAAVLMLAGIAAVSEALSTRRHLVYWKDTEAHHRRMVETAPDDR